MSLPRYQCNEVYQVVENISIYPLYQKLATALGRFCPKVKNLVTIVTLVAYSKQLGSFQIMQAI
jgi:hypothetical protein